MSDTPKPDLVQELERKRHMQQLTARSQPQGTRTKEQDQPEVSQEVDLFVAGKGRQGYRIQIALNADVFDQISLEIFHNRTGLGAYIWVGSLREQRLFERMREKLIQRLQQRGLHLTQLHIRRLNEEKVTEKS